MKAVENAYITSTLQEEPDYAKIEILLVEIRRKLYDGHQ